MILPEGVRSRRADASPSLCDQTAIAAGDQSEAGSVSVEPGSAIVRGKRSSKIT
jgi:hypothetical protein